MTVRGMRFVPLNHAGLPFASSENDCADDRKRGKRNRNGDKDSPGAETELDGECVGERQLPQPKHK